jgi:hypothetical protein
MEKELACDPLVEVLCAGCQRPFHVRFPLARPEAEGTGEVLVTIPRVYIAEEALFRGLRSRH